VIRSDGKIGGYREGIKKKIALLKKEGLSFKSL
jgi:O6-methylguanine-DNA--protein-cysteine methyltransferase